MAEVGLLPFARIALQVAKAVLPRYRGRFNKHQFTQPQLPATLCLMRYVLRASPAPSWAKAAAVAALANLPAVVQTAAQQTPIGLVLADAEFDSERNPTYIRKPLGAQSVIPGKRGKKTWRVHGVRAEMRRAFPRQLSGRRALIESVFSPVQRRLSAPAPGCSLPMQVRQALLLGLSFNLYRLRHGRRFLRMSTEPRYDYLPNGRVVSQHKRIKRMCTQCRFLC